MRQIAAVDAMQPIQYLYNHITGSFVLQVNGKSNITYRCSLLQ